MRSLLSLVGVAAVLASGACGGSEESVLEDADAEIVRTQAQVVLRYDAARKVELIDSRHFKAEDFSGSEIIVKSARTRIDIAYLLPESDITATRPGKRLPLELVVRHDFQLLERTAQPTLPGPLPVDYAEWKSAPAATAASADCVKTPDRGGSEKALDHEKRLKVI